MPQRFAGIDVADTGDTSLVEKEFLQWALGASQEAMEFLRGEIRRKGVDTEHFERWAGFAGRPEVQAAEMALVGEAEDSFGEFKGNVDVDAVDLVVIGALQELAWGIEPDEVAVEAEVHFDEAVIEGEEEIFAVAEDAKDAAAFELFGDVIGLLGFDGDGMEEVDAANFLAAHERADGASDGFDFGKFGHEVSCFPGLRYASLRHGCRSVGRLEGQCVTLPFGFGGVGERFVDGFAFEPVGELVGVVFAAGLAGLAGGDEEN